MSHTPGPWQAYTDPCHYYTMSEIRAGKMVVEVGGDTSTVEQEDNTLRIVACVNACEGLSTELLSMPGYRIKNELDSLDEQIVLRLKAEKESLEWKERSLRAEDRKIWQR